jgi:hypothetical protein
MAKKNGLDDVLHNIDKAMNSRQYQAEKAAQEFSKRAVIEFRNRQFSPPPDPNDPHEPGKARADTAEDKAAAIAYSNAHSGGAPVTLMGDPWINRSFRAARSVHASYESTETEVSFRLYHTMSYGVYLELARNRKYAVLEPIVRGLAPEFLERIKAIYAG